MSHTFLSNVTDFVTSVLGVRKVPEFELREFLNLKDCSSYLKELEAAFLNSCWFIFFLMFLPLSHCEALK